MALVKYIIALSNTCSYQRIYKVLAMADFLVVGTSFETNEIITMDNGDLQFSYDIGGILSRSVLSDYSFPHSLSATELECVPSAVTATSYGPMHYTLAHYYSFMDNKPYLQKLVDLSDFSSKLMHFSGHLLLCYSKKKSRLCRSGAGRLRNNTGTKCK